jgi:hypothetical protein
MKGKKIFYSDTGRERYHLDRIDQSTGNVTFFIENFVHLMKNQL